VPLGYTYSGLMGGNNRSGVSFVIGAWACYHDVEGLSAQGAGWNVSGEGGDCDGSGTREYYLKRADYGRRAKAQRVVALVSLYDCLS
jgi:hypothetical protein